MAKYHFAKTVKIVCALALALVVAGSSLGVFAATRDTAAHAQAFFTPKLSATKGPQLKILDEHTVNAAAIPRASQAALQRVDRTASLVNPLSAKEAAVSLARRAAAAPHNAGENLLSSSGLDTSPNTSTPTYPSTFNKFSGLSQSPSSCGNSKCLVSFPSVAAAPTGLALQNASASLSLYNNDGALQSGWPKLDQTFFGVPNPQPAGCDPNGPFLLEPRAWFDAFDNRFGVSILQLEDAEEIAPSCNFVSQMWVAVSTTNNPNGAWRVFSYSMNFGSDPTGVADLPQLGFDADGLFFSANILNQDGTAFEYAEAVGCGKQAIYDGGAIVCTTESDFGADNTKNAFVAMDTVSPVESLATDSSPHAEFFVNTFNFEGDLNGNDCMTTACNGVVVWSWSDPANTSGSGDVLAGFYLPTANSYVVPPNADQPGCTGGADCVITYLGEISGTPTYHAGHIYAAHETGVTNASSQFVSGIQWFDIEPKLTTGWPAAIDGATEDQDGLLNARNDWLACINPVIMPDLDNDLILGYNYLGDTQYPSINYTFRRVTDPASTLTGGLGIVEVAGTANASDFEVGIWSGMSYPATYQDFIWFTSSYSTSSSLWNTELIKLRFNLNG